MSCHNVLEINYAFANLSILASFLRITETVHLCLSKQHASSVWASLCLALHPDVKIYQDALVGLALVIHDRTASWPIYNAACSCQMSASENLNKMPNQSAIALGLKNVAGNGGSSGNKYFFSDFLHMPILNWCHLIMNASQDAKPQITADQICHVWT